MTLCIVWRTEDDIHFASDSRLTFGGAVSDAGIKVGRVPFSIYRPGGDDASVLMSGELGMAFAGSAVNALMVKEALSEVVRNLQGVPGHHRMDMDGIADVMARGFEAIGRIIGASLRDKIATCIVFAGFCPSQNKLRAFRMEVSPANEYSYKEVLSEVGDHEVFGSPSAVAVVKAILKPSSTQKEILGALQTVIDDQTIAGVGGPIQFGHFVGRSFRPVGVAVLGDTAQGIHYWRGPLDLNGPEFDQERGLFPRFPLLDMIS